MTGTWTFILTDAAGNGLAELSTASGRSISFKRCSYSEVNLTLSHEDDAAGLLFSALANTGVPKLKGYRRGIYDTPGQPATLRFRGPLIGLSETSEESSLLTATFRSPFATIIGDGDATGRFLTSAAATAFTSMDAGAIAKTLIDGTNSQAPTGLATNSSLIVASATRSALYPVAQNIGSAITTLSSLLDGFDFFETFVDGVGATDAFFNAVPAMGAVNPAARFEYGPSTLNNVQSMTRTQTPPQNAVFVTGANGLTSSSGDAASIAKYGSWMAHYDLSDVTDQATLNAMASALVRPNPIKTISFVPELALSPVPFDDWNLGDTVPFYASRFALSENAQLRVNGFTIPIDENGYETVTVDDPTLPEEDAVTRAQLDTEVTITS